MSEAFLLLALRIVSGLILLAILMSLFIMVWRDYRQSTGQTAAGRRVYGYLKLLRELDGNYHITGEAYPLLPLTSLGRSPTNTIPISDTFASSEHALIALRDGQWWLEDRQSRNGTLINDIRVTQPVVITNGDIIGIGQLKFRVEIEPT